MRALLAIMSAMSVHGDMRAAFRELSIISRTGEAEEAVTEARGTPLIVTLERVHSSAGAASSWVDGGSFYVGRVSVGRPEPQELRVLFDTASGHVILPHSSCESQACKKRRVYSPASSWTAADVNRNGSLVDSRKRLSPGSFRDGVTIGFAQADLGEGDAQGVFVRDSLCLGDSIGSQKCTEVSIVAATSLASVPFEAMPHDGIIGLSLEGLSSSRLCNFFGRMVAGSEGVLPQFGVSFGPTGGELYIGGHDPTRLMAPLQWFPVLQPEQGFWQVAIRAVRVGNVTVDPCPGACRGIVDTGASRLGVQADRLPSLSKALAAVVACDGGCKGPDLEFDLGSMSLILRATDYASAACTPQLGELQLEEPEFVGVYALGERVLRRYYAAFDWESKLIGFSPAVGRFVRLGPPTAGAVGKATSTNDAERTKAILV